VHLLESYHPASQKNQDQFPGRDRDQACLIAYLNPFVCCSKIRPSIGEASKASKHQADINDFTAIFPPFMQQL
jgi:hypothetical protein